MLVIDFENKCSAKRQTVITKAVTFAFNQLMPRVRKPVFININTIRKLADKKGIYGDCLDEGDREFTIRIDVSLPLEDMITTLLHEMVHVYQYVSGRMKYKWIHEVSFDRVVYDWDMDYNKRPWEIEAHSKEKELKDKYDEYYGN